MAWPIFDKYLVLGRNIYYTIGLQISNILWNEGKETGVYSCSLLPWQRGPGAVESTIQGPPGVPDFWEQSVYVDGGGQKRKWRNNTKWAK